jgi:predicted nuclease of predicted toxin-antitoxin system
MMIQLVVDMNLSPDWVPVLMNHGWHTLHWSTVGDARATDRAIMDWAVANGYVVFTHDLDFGTLLALTHATGPSVVQVRGQDVLPDVLEPAVVGAIRLYEADLAAGALVVIDVAKSRVRVLPI